MEINFETIILISSLAVLGFSIYVFIYVKKKGIYLNFLVKENARFRHFYAKKYRGESGHILPGEKWIDRFENENKNLYLTAENENISQGKLIYEKKKEKFLNIANISFHYADKDRIKAFYEDYFKEPTIKNFIKETVSESEASLKGNIPSIIESKMGGKDLSKWISNIRLPHITENGMFKRYQNETIIKDQVILGLEEDDIELSVLREFESKVNEVEKQYGFIFDQVSLDTHKTKLKEKAAEQTLSNLEKANGWVLVEGNFQIKNENEEFYKVTMVHPVSKYLTSGKEITISSLVSKNKIEPSVSGNYSNSLNKNIPLKIYGQVWQPINRIQNTLDLMITPLAIY